MKIEEIQKIINGIQNCEFDIIVLPRTMYSQIRTLSNKRRHLLTDAILDYYFLGLETQQIDLNDVLLWDSFKLVLDKKKQSIRNAKRNKNGTKINQCSKINVLNDSELSEENESETPSETPSDHKKIHNETNLKPLSKNNVLNDSELCNKNESETPSETPSDQQNEKIKNSPKLRQVCAEFAPNLKPLSKINVLNDSELSEKNESALYIYKHINILNNKDYLVEKEKIKEKGTKKIFVPPTQEEAQEFFSANCLVGDPIEFWNYYESNGWQVGKNKMKNWQASARNWSLREKKVKQPTTTKSETELKPNQYKVGNTIHTDPRIIAKMARNVYETEKSLFDNVKEKTPADNLGDLF